MSLRLSGVAAISLCLLSALPALTQESELPSESAAGEAEQSLVEEEDARSRVILSSDCRTERSRRDLTLFANGTVRLRDGIGATRTMRLAELGDVEMEAFLARLSDIRFDDLAPQSPGLEGDLVESCHLVLALPGLDQRVFDYGRFDSIPLGLRHVLFVVEDLLAEFRSTRAADDRARGYTPRIGDIVVRRRDGARFEVLGFTIEGTGVELQGIDQPITVFILKDEILEEYDPPDPEADR